MYLGFQLCSQKHRRRMIEDLKLFLVYSQIWLNLPRNDCHFFYILLWMMGTLATSQKLTKKSAAPPKARICVAVSSFPDLFLPDDDDDLELVVGYLCSFALFFLSCFAFGLPRMSLKLEISSSHGRQLLPLLHLVPTISARFFLLFLLIRFLRCCFACLLYIQR